MYTTLISECSQHNSFEHVFEFVEQTEEEESILLVQCLAGVLHKRGMNMRQKNYQYWSRDDSYFPLKAASEGGEEKTATATLLTNDDDHCTIQDIVVTCNDVCKRLGNIFLFFCIPLIIFGENKNTSILAYQNL